MSVTDTPRFVGSPVLRKEDDPLLRGQGTFVANLELPGLAHMSVVRSPYPHARIVSVDLEAARAAEGVVAVFSGADLRDSWPAPMPVAWPVTPEMKSPAHYPLAADVARFQGDGVAVVLAESSALAKDAAELVEIEYEPLPVAVGVEASLAEGAPLVHPEVGTNECYVWRLSTDDVDDVFAKADVVVSRRYYQPRLIPTAIETRGVVARPEPNGFVTVWSATQIPHILKVMIAACLGINETKVRLIAPDVGGGFGSKADVYAEEFLAVALSRRLDRPVKWVEERSENYVSTIHGRDYVTVYELAATRGGKILGCRANVKAAMGAYLQLITPGIPLLGAWLYAGPYDIPAYGFTCTGVFTNATPTDAYRGAGRPEATYVIERTMDALAAELGMDRLELRRRNFIREFPRQIASGLTIDSGDYSGALDRLEEMLDLDAFRAEQAARRERGDARQLGIGFSTYNEMCGIAPSRILGAIGFGAGGWESSTVRFLPTGTVQAVTGTSPHGQGHETAFSQIVADRFGVDVSEVEVLHGDTAIAPYGLDTYGSRSLPIGGAALHVAAERVVEKARQIVAHQLEVSADDLEYDAGTFSVKGSPDRSMPIKGAAWAAFAAHNLPDGMDPYLEATATYDAKNFSWPGGAHACVAEVDVETGDARVVRYVAVDEIGTVVNPMIADGQVHGGVTQGIAAALYEEGVYDDEGNLTTANLVTYLVPSAVEVPSFELDRVSAPSPEQPLGAKGVGETGTIASAPAVVNAVVDAVSHLGVTDVGLPATPERVWRAIQSAKEAGQ